MSHAVPMQPSATRRRRLRALEIGDSSLLSVASFVVLPWSLALSTALIAIARHTLCLAIV